MTATITEDTTHVIFSNPLATFKLKKANATGETLIISGGVNVIDEPARFVAYHDGSTLKRAQSVSYEIASPSEGTLSFKFSAGQVTVGCRAHETHFVFELFKVGSGIVAAATQILIARLSVAGQDNSEFAGIVYCGADVVSELALDIETHVVCTPGRLNAISPMALPAALEPAPRLPRVKVCLLACHQAEWLNLVEGIEIQHGLPHPTIHNVWAKRHPDARSSYLFLDITETNAAAVVEYALRGGFKHIVPYVWTWAKTTGTYLINDDADNYPSGLDGLRSVATRVHSNNLKFGLHMFSCLISTNDPYVRGTPTSRLAKESPIALVSIEQDPEQLDGSIIHTAGPPNDYKNYYDAGEKDIIIDNEIMTMYGVNVPAAELRVRRGQHHTPIERHASGTMINHLPAYKGDYYFPDLRSNLLAEIAENFAAFYKDVKGDFVFLDGNDTLDRVFQWGSWFTVPLIAETFFRRLPSNVFLEGASTQHNHQWHAISRGVSGDFAAIGVEAYMDHEKLGRFGERYKKAFFPQELGWIALLAKTGRTTDEDSFSTTTVDEIEYQLNRSLGHGVPIGLETRVDDLQANGLTGAILDLISKYEELRLNNYFPLAVLEKLKQANKKFLQVYGLAKDQYQLVGTAAGNYAFRHRAYLEHLVRDGRGESWEFENPFPNQPLRMKITALPSHGTYTGRDALTLAGPSLDGFEVVSQSPGVELTINDDQITATFDPNAPDAPVRGWCSLTKRLTDPQDLSNHKVIGLRVTGDGKGEVVSIELGDDQEINRQYRFTIDFSDFNPDGTRRPRSVILPMPATKELFRYPYHQRTGIPVNIKRSLRPFGYRSVVQLTIHVMNIPEGSIGFSLGAIKAIRQQHKPISSPACVVNSKEIVFGTTLNPRKTRMIGETQSYVEPWEYLAFNGIKYRTFDGNHQELETGAPTGEKPIVKNGKNTITYRHVGPNKALVRIMIEDSPAFPGTSNDATWSEF